MKVDYILQDGRVIDPAAGVDEIRDLYVSASRLVDPDNGRPGTDPVALIKMVLIQHLYGIPSLRQTYQRIQDTIYAEPPVFAS